MGKWNRKVVGYEIEEVEALPPTLKERAEQKNRFVEEILAAFRQSNAQVAKLDLHFENEESEPVLNGEIEYASNQIKRLLKAQGVSVVRRDGDVYLVRNGDSIEHS